MFLLRSAGTRLSLLFEEDQRTPKSHPSQTSRGEGRHFNNHFGNRQRDQPDDGPHARKCTQFPSRPTNRRISTDGGSMGETHDGRGFFPSLSRTAFTQAVFQSNVFLPKLNALRIPVSFHTALKTAELHAFLDSGATECFVSQRFIDTYKLGTHLLNVLESFRTQTAPRMPEEG